MPRCVVHVSLTVYASSPTFIGGLPGYGCA
jgi:hypothetical protein